MQSMSVARTTQRCGCAKRNRDIGVLCLHAAEQESKRERQAQRAPTLALRVCVRAGRDADVGVLVHGCSRAAAAARQREAGARTSSRARARPGQCAVGRHGRSGRLWDECRVRFPAPNPPCPS